MSTLPINAPLPVFKIKLIACFTVQYCSEKSFLSMPSLTLCAVGKDKSNIRRHAFPFFGITPNRLTWRCLSGGVFVGQTTLPRLTSLFRYSSITAGCSMAEGQFDVADFNLHKCEWKEFIYWSSVECRE